MDKLKMHSPDLTKANIDKIADLFPNVVTEPLDAEGQPIRAITFDALRQELSDHVIEGPQERYQLDWPGKRAAAFAANAPIAKTLRPVREESVNFDTTRNLFIEGDNLEALKLLQESYLGKVKLIYIDPPYNTGNDFVYEDDFAESSTDYLARSGQMSETGDRLVANTEANGRFHSDWLSMMYPRLKLARNLLAETGVIFISINDAEVENLKHLASEVFGAQNFIGNVVWAAGRKNDSRFISASHEYMLCFARNAQELSSGGNQWRVRKKGLQKIYAAADDFVARNQGDYLAAATSLREWFATLPDSDDAKRSKHYSMIDERGVYFADNLSKNTPTSRSRYDIYHPSTGKPVKMPENGWRYAPEQMERLLEEGRIRFGVDESTIPTFKRYLRDTEEEVLYSVFYQDGRAASKRLASLMDGAVFDFPKDETVIQTIVEMTTSSDDVVMDFFAGSGTTAHAVLAANAADGGSRRFILVQLDEPVPTASAAAKAGYTKISQISRERIRRAAEKLASSEESAPIDGGFRALRVDSTNMLDISWAADDLVQAALEDSIDNVKPGRSHEDLLFQVMLDWGLDLTEPIGVEDVEGVRVLTDANDALIGCFVDNLSDGVLRALADRHPLRVVFKDSGFADDAARINAEQIFREVSPETEVKTI